MKKMDNRYYNILGVSPNATNEEIEMQYQTLKAKYQKERFLEGEEGNNAAKMLTEIEMRDLIMQLVEKHPAQYLSNGQTIISLLTQDEIQKRF